MEEENNEGRGGRENEAEGVAPALISVHPQEYSVAVAIGSELRVYSLRDNCMVDLQGVAGGLSHSDSIRAICFGANGTLFASGGDDKLVKVWSTDSWHCIQTTCAEKRVSSVALSSNGSFLTFADKFGVIWVVEVDVAEKSSSPITKVATPIFGHYCSIITSLEFSPDGQFIASADRDFKIRVRLWDYENGLLLHTCEVGVKVVEMQKSFIPTSLRISSVGHLWIIAGASETYPSNAVSEPEDAKQMPNTGVCAFACIKVIRLSDQQQATILEEAEVPGGTELLKGLQGKILDDADVATFALVAEAANRALHNLLIKRQYPAEKRELRKRNRNDKKQQH
ncbi:tRNA guanine-N7-methyltransferase non-catalytic subunit [Nymphaea thermarum]|nr:tRNA guanine-N7-methyltransferase non-catalytic subunit [Nymphaea thermarum]